MKVSQLSHLGMLCIAALQYYRSNIPDYVLQNAEHNVFVEKYGLFISIELHMFSVSLRPGDKYYDEILQRIQ